MEKVLIALDYDPTAQIVAESGYFLAKSMGAEVILLHVIEKEAYYSVFGILETYPSPGFMGINEVEATKLFDGGLKKAMTRFLDKSRTYLGDETIKTLVKKGDFAETILKTANGLKADVIVMGSHSKKLLESIIMGSVTEHVLRHTTIPLFMIPTKKE